MKKFLINLKTSDKITILFSFYNFLSLIVLLIWINIIYFFTWYSDQKTESMYDINVNYNMYLSEKTDNNLEAFKKYILQKDTLIIPNDWSELICSNWVSAKVHDNIEEIKNKLFYNSWEKIYFIYSNYYDDIWEVKVFFDTTPYVKSQLIIIKISLIIILISIFINYIVWKIISKYALKNLKNIIIQTKDIDIESDFKKIEIIWNIDDEINILAETLNKSICHIQKQTSNLKQFITDVSHEFKTPLMVINSQIDLYNKKLEKSKLTENDTGILLEKIKSKTYKLNKILETFFLLSRVENNIEKLDKNSMNLNNCLEIVTKNYLLNIDKKVEIYYNFKSDILLDIEISTFNIIVENILSNAIKFSWEKAKIEIWADETSFWISDSWAWIEKNKLDKIWKKFYRNDTNIEWFWVWLFIVKRLVELYNWDVKIESKKEKWTKFIVNFK